jgi:hypothetical protein
MREELLERADFTETNQTEWEEKLSKLKVEKNYLNNDNNLEDEDQRA